MQICEKEHKECRGNQESTLPTRVLDVGTPKRESVRLHTTTRTDTSPFIALRYCWGKSGNLTTVKANLDARKQEIPWSSIPQIMRDAIQVTRHLGIRYVWIDALCIIQDDPQDWDREASQMKDVYANACLVISGTRAGDCHQTLFGERRASATNYREHIPARFSTEKVTPVSSELPSWGDISSDTNGTSNQPTVFVRDALGHDLLDERAEQDLDQHPLYRRPHLVVGVDAPKGRLQPCLPSNCHRGWTCTCGRADDELQRLHHSPALIPEILEADFEDESKEGRV